MSDAGNNPQVTWADGLDEEARGYVESRGLGAKSASEAMATTIKAHRDAMAEITRLHNTQNAVRLPDRPDDKAGWDAVWKRLGRPDTPDAYKIEGLKFADGSDPDEGFVTRMRAISHELNLPADAASVLARRVMELGDVDAAAEREAHTRNETMAETALRGAWGAQHDYFSFQVGRAMDMLGMGTEIAQMARAAGPDAYVKFMQGMRGLAARMGEAEMLRGERGQSTPAYTAETAQARIDELRNNPAWVKKWANKGEAGHEEAVEEFANLFKVIAQARDPRAQTRPF